MTAPPQPLAGAAALVVGGSSGLGLACARWFAAAGAAVTIAARDRDRLASAAEALADVGAVRAQPCDTADEHDVAAAVAAASADGPLRAVVAAAGTGWIAPLATIPRDAWDHVVAVNLTGTFLLLKHAAEPMASAGGAAFTAISSVNAVRHAPFHAAYCATKAAVDALVRSAADELGPAGIRVNAVRPGLVPTPLSDSLVHTEPVRDDFLAQMPLGRLGTPEDVADAVGYLTTASWVTGVCLSVDGGNHLRRSPHFDAFVAPQHPGAPAWWGLSGAGGGGASADGGAPAPPTASPQDPAELDRLADAD